MNKIDSPLTYAIRMKVIASAGSPAKVEYMKSLGAEITFNYKETSYEAALKEHGPIQVYWVIKHHFIS